MKTTPYPHSLFILLLLLSFLTFYSHAVKSDEKIYTFGVVPQFDARHIHNIWRPILDQVENRTGLKFRIVGSRSIPDFELQFMEGEFDFAYMNPYHALKATDKNLYIPMVRDVERSLYGIIVVHKDSKINRVEDLRNKTIVYPAPNAIGASLIPRADLKRQFKLETNQKYVHNHSSVYLHVALGRADAGGGVHKTLRQQPKHIQDQLKVIYATRRFSPHPIMAANSVDSSVREKVKKAFLAMASNPTDQKLLSKVPIKKIGEAKPKDYLIIKDWKLEEFYVR